MTDERDDPGIPSAVSDELTGAGTAAPIRAEPAAPRSSDEAEEPGEAPVAVDELERVPYLGEGRRWYDPPGRLVRWLRLRAQRRRVPRFILDGLMRLEMVLISVNSLEQYRRRTGSMRPWDVPIELPAGERIEHGGFWLVELYPPSVASRLTKAAKRHGWGDRPGRMFDEPMTEVIERARRRSGRSWFRLAEIVGSHGRWRRPDSQLGRLPAEIEGVELVAVQIGRSLTAVVAFFRLSELGRLAMDATLRGEHEPTLRWNRGRPLVDSSHFMSMLNTQAERQRLHDLGRRWMARACPRYFAQREDGAPVIDLAVLQEADPTKDLDRDMRDVLRALGMDEGGYRLTSPQLPSLVLTEGRALPRPYPGLRNCWGLVARHSDLRQACADRGYGWTPDDAMGMAQIMDDDVRNLALYLGVYSYAQQQIAAYAEARDRARERYRRSSPRRLQRLSNELLSLSLDMSVTARDARLPWTDDWRQHYRIDVHGDPPESWQHPPPRWNFIEHLGKVTTESLDELTEEDRTYRDVLATAASINASAADARLGRRAIVAALASLAVAVVTLLATTRIPEWVADLVGGGS